MDGMTIISTQKPYDPSICLTTAVLQFKNPLFKKQPRPVGYAMLIALFANQSARTSLFKSCFFLSPCLRFYESLLRLIYAPRRGMRGTGLSSTSYLTIISSVPSMGSQEREGIGAHTMWGYTPAKDLLQDAPLRGEVRASQNGRENRTRCILGKLWL